MGLRIRRISACGGSRDGVELSVRGGVEFEHLHVAVARRSRSSRELITATNFFELSLTMRDRQLSSRSERAIRQSRSACPRPR